MCTKLKSDILSFNFFKNDEYNPQHITAPIIHISPILKFKFNKISKLNFVIITKIPKTEIKSPSN